MGAFLWDKKDLVISGSYGCVRYPFMTGDCGHKKEYCTYCTYCWDNPFLHNKRLIDVNLQVVLNLDNGCGSYARHRIRHHAICSCRYSCKDATSSTWFEFDWRVKSGVRLIYNLARPETIPSRLLFGVRSS